MLPDFLRPPLPLHMADLRHHNGADGGNEAAEAVNDLLRVLIVSVLLQARDGADHDLVHGPVDADRQHGDEQRGAGTEMLQAFPQGDGPVADPAPQPGHAAQVANQGGQAPDQAVDPQISLLLHENEDAGRCGALDEGIPQGDGSEVSQTHQGPVEAHQAADAHQGQMEGDLPLLPGDQKDISKPEEQHGPGDHQLHLPDGREGPVQGFPVVPDPGHRPDAVIIQPQHRSEAEDIADVPGGMIKPHTLRAHGPGKVGGGDEGQQHGKQAVRHIVHRVFSRADGHAFLRFEGPGRCPPRAVFSFVLPRGLFSPAVSRYRCSSALAMPK